MKDNDIIYTVINDTLKNVDVSSGIGLLNIHTIPHSSESSKVDDINMSVYNDDVNGDYFYINGSTEYVISYHNSVDYKKKRDEITANKYLRENNGLQVGLYISYTMLPASAHNQYFNM